MKKELSDAILMVYDARKNGGIKYGETIQDYVRHSLSIIRKSLIIQGIISDMKEVSRSENRVNLESEKYKAAVRLTWDNARKTGLIDILGDKTIVIA